MVLHHCLCIFCLLANIPNLPDLIYNENKHRKSTQISNYRILNHVNIIRTVFCQNFCNFNFKKKLFTNRRHKYRHKVCVCFFSNEISLSPSIIIKSSFLISVLFIKKTIWNTKSKKNVPRSHPFKRLGAHVEVSMPRVWEFAGLDTRLRKT